MPIQSTTSADRGEYARFEPSETTRHQKPEESASSHSHTPKRSWRAPAVMLISLTLGLGIALAHHSMGLKLNNRPVADVYISQAWVSRFSTALAFLVKASFAICVGTAYFQHQWLRLHQQNYKLRTSEVDALTNVLGSIFSFFSSAIWLKHPILTLMALVSWFMPLAAVVAPGSLTVSPMRNTTTVNLQVPQLEMLNTSNYGTHTWGPLRPDPRVKRLAYQVATSGSPVPIVPPPSLANSTYHLDFDGPAMQCEGASDDIVRNCTAEFGTDDTRRILNLRINQTSRSGSSYSTELALYDADLDYLSKDAARLYVMTNRVNNPWERYLTDDGPVYGNPRLVNVTECRLFDATYSVDFGFQEGVQTQNVTITKWNYPVPLYTPGGTVFNRSFDPHAALMQALGIITIGTASYSATYDTNYGEKSTSTGEELLSIDWDDEVPVIQRSLERLFENLTLSLLSNDDFLKKSTNADMVLVDVFAWPVTYVYSMSDLLTTYGVAFLCTLSCSAVGLWAFFANGASYQNLFSTYLRATNDDADLRSYLEAGDEGADPLPKVLARAYVALSGNTIVESSELEPERRESGTMNIQRLSLDEVGMSSRMAGTNAHNETASVSHHRGSVHSQADAIGHAADPIGSGDQANSEGGGLDEPRRDGQDSRDHNADN